MPATPQGHKTRKPPQPRARLKKLTAKENASEPAAGANGRSRERIMQGALRAIRMRGPTLLSMVDVCEAAGISRATLYRYFSHKDEVLAAVAEYVSEGFIVGVHQAAGAAANPVDLVRRVLTFTWTYTTRVQTRNLLEVEPGFVMRFLESQFERHVAVFNEVLSPAYDELDRHLGIRIDRRLISEFVLRGEHSALLIRAGASWNSLPETLPALLQGILAQPR